MELINRIPDSAQAVAFNDFMPLRRDGGAFSDAETKIEFIPAGDGLAVRVSSPRRELTHVRLRWNIAVPAGCRLTGDALERGYGDLEWHGMNADRRFFWYVLAASGGASCGYGVKVRPSAIAIWQLDSAGVTLWLDVKCGGEPVRLGDRVLDAAVIVSARSDEGESAYAFARRFCALMSPVPLPVPHPVYGSNNWYYAYGDSSHEKILEDTKLLAELTSGNSNRPYMVIDACWQPHVDIEICAGGPMTRGNAKFPDMPGLAAGIRELGARPGIWARLLKTNDADMPERMLIAGRAERLFDPTVPEALEYIKADVSRLRGWGYELIKHDYSTFDFFGKWAFEMPFQLTDRGWSFADRSKTTAQAIKAFYAAILEASGGALILGCNTVGHLAAGLEHIQRVGDDTSGFSWDRTRRMGVNTLAFRGPQHRTFFEADADCFGHTGRIPWELNARWLDILSKSGTPLFVSADPTKLDAAQRQALREAFRRASLQRDACEPLDWMETACPAEWLINGEKVGYEWDAPDGVWEM